MSKKNPGDWEYRAQKEAQKRLRGLDSLSVAAAASASNSGSSSGYSSYEEALDSITIREIDDTLSAAQKFEELERLALANTQMRQAIFRNELRMQQLRAQLWPNFQSKPQPQAQPKSKPEEEVKKDAASNKALFIEDKTNKCYYSFSSEHVMMKVLEKNEEKNFYIVKKAFLSESQFKEYQESQSMIGPYDFSFVIIQDNEAEKIEQEENESKKVNMILAQEPKSEVVVASKVLKKDNKAIAESDNSFEIG